MEYAAAATAAVDCKQSSRKRSRTVHVNGTSPQRKPKAKKCKTEKRIKKNARQRELVDEKGDRYHELAAALGYKWCGEKGHASEKDGILTKCDILRKTVQLITMLQEEYKMMDTQVVVSHHTSQFCSSYPYPTPPRLATLISEYDAATTDQDGYTATPGDIQTVTVLCTTSPDPHSRPLILECSETIPANLEEISNSSSSVQQPTDSTTDDIILQPAATTSQCWMSYPTEEFFSSHPAGVNGSNTAAPFLSASSIASTPSPCSSAVFPIPTDMVAMYGQCPDLVSPLHFSHLPGQLTLACDIPTSLEVEVSEQ